MNTVFEDFWNDLRNANITDYWNESTPFELLALLVIVPFMLFTFFAFIIRFRRETPHSRTSNGGYRRRGFWRTWFGGIHPEFIGALITGILFLLIGRVQAGFEAEQLREDLIARMNNPTNVIAVLAVEELRANGWLQDGSLSGRVFDKANLAGADFRGADLRCVHFFNRMTNPLHTTTLEGAHFDGAKLDHVTLTEVSIANASFRDASLVGISGVSSGGETADFTGATLSNTIMNVGDGELNLEAAQIVDISDPVCSDGLDSEIGTERQESILAGQSWYLVPAQTLMGVRLNDMIDTSALTEGVGLLILLPLAFFTFILFVLDVRRRNRLSTSTDAAASSDPRLQSQDVGVVTTWFSDVHAEFVGALLTGLLFLGVGLIGNAAETQDRRELLISQMSSKNPTAASIAVEELRSAGWLTDGSLSGRSFEGINLSQVNFKGANFEGATFTNVNFTDANLEGAVLDSAALIDVNFEGANMTNVSARRATFTNVNMEGGEKRSMNFANATFVDVTFTGAKLQGSCFAYSNLTSVTFHDLTGNSGTPFFFDTDFFGATADDATIGNMVGSNEVYSIDGLICRDSFNVSISESNSGNIPAAGQG